MPSHWLLSDDEMSAEERQYLDDLAGANGVAGRHGRSDLLVGAGLRNTAQASGQADQCAASVLIQSRRHRTGSYRTMAGCGRSNFICVRFRNREDEAFALIS